MKKLVYLVVLIVSTQVAFGQILTKKEKHKLYDEAEEAFELANYLGAYDAYTQLRKYDRDEPELNFNLGYCVFMLGGSDQEAISYFEVASAGEYMDANFYLGMCFHRLGKFKIAQENYQYFKEHDKSNEIPVEEVNRLIDVSLRASQMKKNPIGVEIFNAGAGINTKYQDYVPVISQDDSMMIFTSRRDGSTGAEKDPYGNYFEDIYIAYKQFDPEKSSESRKVGTWLHAQNIGTTINTKSHDASVGLSPDGKTLIIFRTNKDKTGGDLYYSNFTDGKWQSPVKYSENINSDYSESSASITLDGNKMYFSSNRPGGYGGKDIYRCVKFGNGDWSKPLNLGPNINTPQDDDAPFVLADGKTLYFSSKGHTTMGGYDIFKSVLNTDSKVWSRPQNLGYPINSVKDDIYFVIAGNERTGYYSSDKPKGMGGQDIYEVDLLDKNTLITIVKGIIKDEAGEIMSAKITVIDETSNRIRGVYRANARNGKYLMSLVPGVKYKMLVAHRGYETIHEDIEYTANENFAEYKRDIILKKKVKKND